MKQAVVVNVGHGPAALKHAIATQMLLLDRLGAGLDSIRLAVPRLLHHACASAIDEKPDMLVVVGGPRSARRAGQLAYRTGTPILFLPNVRLASWAQHLWGSLSFEDMVAAIAHGDLTPVRVGVGMVENQIFFEQAGFGLLPHLPELRHALDEADTFGESWQVVERAAQLSRLLVAPNIHFRSGDSNHRRAKALIVKTPTPNTPLGSWRGPPPPAFECSASRYGAPGLFRALIRYRRGVEGWGQSEHFNCFTIDVDAGRPTWTVLDEDTVRFDGAVEIRFIPSAIQTFLFNPAHQHANDNPKVRSRKFRTFSAPLEPGRNFRSTFHVATNENRESGVQRHRKQV